MSSTYRMYNHRTLVIACLGLLLLQGCGVAKQGSSAPTLPNSSIQATLRPLTATSTPLAERADTAMNTPLFAIPTPNPAHQFIKLYLYTPEPILAMSREDGYFMIGTAKIQGYTQIATDKVLYVVSISPNTFMKLRDGDPITYISSYGVIERDFGTLNKSTLTGQENLFIRRTNIVTALETLVNTTSNETLQSPMHDVQQRMHTTVDNSLWESSTLVQHDQATALFTSDHQLIQSLMNLPADAITEQDQGSIKRVIAETVRLDGLLVRQMLDLNTRPITNQDLWYHAYDSLTYGERAAMQADYLGALALYEQAWDVALQATQ